MQKQGKDGIFSQTLGGGVACRLDGRGRTPLHRRIPRQCKVCGKAEETVLNEGGVSYTNTAPRIGICADCINGRTENLKRIILDGRGSVSRPTGRREDF